MRLVALRFVGEAAKLVGLRMCYQLPLIEDDRTPIWHDLVWILKLFKVGQAAWSLNFINDVSIVLG